MLAGSVTELDLDKRELGDVDAAALGSLLPRAASSLTALRLWWVAPQLAPRPWSGSDHGSEPAPW